MGSILAFILGSVLITQTLAGVGSSGGGPSIVCRNPVNKNIESAELLDLFESKIRFGYSIVYGEDKDIRINEAINRIKNNKFTKNLIKESLNKILTATKFLPAGVSLQIGNDLGSEYGVLIKEGCSLEYAGFYETDGSLKIVLSIYDAFTPTDKAAFFVHETVYKLARETSGVNNSASSRKLTAALFAKNVSAESIEKMATDLFFQIPGFEVNGQKMPESFAILKQGKDPSGIIELITSPTFEYDYNFEVYCGDWSRLEGGKSWINLLGRGPESFEISDSEECHRLWLMVTPGPLDKDHGETTPEPLPFKLVSNGIDAIQTDNNAGWQWIQVINLTREIEQLVDLP